MKLNSKKIKLIAVVCMLVDHLICQYYGPQYFCIRDQLNFRIMQPFDPYPQLWGLAGVLSDGVSFLLSVLGRMAAVLFFFLLAEGFSHTRSVKKYIVRLLAFGAAAQIGYTLFDGGKLVPLNEMRFNIMFTMAAALFALWCVQKLKGRPYLAVPAALGVTAAKVALDLEYSYQCVAYVFFFYYGKKLKAYQRAILGILLACGLNVYRFRSLITETGMLCGRTQPCCFAHSGVQWRKRKTVESIPVFLLCVLSRASADIGSAAGYLISVWAVTAAVHPLP